MVGDILKSQSTKWKVAQSGSFLSLFLFPFFFVSFLNSGVATILWPPDMKSGFIGKDPDAGKDGRPKEKRAAEDKMVR